MFIIEILGWVLLAIVAVFVLTIAAFCISYAAAYGRSAGSDQGARPRKARRHD